MAELHIEGSQIAFIVVEMSVRLPDSLQSVTAGLVFVAALPVTAAAQSVSPPAPATGAESEHKPQVSLSDTSVQRPSTITLAPTGDWGCCVPPGKEDAGTESPRHPNAPKTFGGALRVGGSSGALSVGIVGSQNARLPLFMSTTLGGSQVQMPAVPSTSDMSRSETRWQIVASAQKNLFTSKTGATVGVIGDVFVPIGSQSPDGVPVNPLISSRAVRFGVKVGF